VEDTISLSGGKVQDHRLPWSPETVPGDLALILFPSIFPEFLPVCKTVGLHLKKASFLSQGLDVQFFSFKGGAQSDCERSTAQKDTVPDILLLLRCACGIQNLKPSSARYVSLIVLPDYIIKFIGRGGDPYQKG
jgi:hypothetical protein